MIFIGLGEDVNWNRDMSGARNFPRVLYIVEILCLSRKTNLLQAFWLVFHTFWLDTTWLHGLLHRSEKGKKLQASQVFRLIVPLLGTNVCVQCKCHSMHSMSIFNTFSTCLRVSSCRLTCDNKISSCHFPRAISTVFPKVASSSYSLPSSKASIRIMHITAKFRSKTWPRFLTRMQNALVLASGDGLMYDVYLRKIKQDYRSL